MSIKKLTKINKLALQYFGCRFQKSKRAQEYVYARISKQTADAFYIGYAPRQGLIDWLEKHKIDLKIAKELGLIQLNYDDTVFETFSNRIIFPIIHAGLVLGFGGRTLTEKQPKYINSKTSLLYNKKEILYGLWKTRRYIDKVGYALLVEGYFDVLSLFNHGVKNCVATCGTAFTQQQAILLRRYTDRVYTFFDGDTAGITSAKKAKKILNALNIYGGNIILPKGYDPDEYIEEYGKKGLKKLKIKS